MSLRPITLAAALACGALLLSGLPSVQAQGPMGGPPRGGMGGGMRPGGRMMQALNLTPAQQAKITAIQQDSTAKIMAVLTPAQRKQMAAMRAQWGGGRPGGPGGPPRG